MSKTETNTNAGSEAALSLSGMLVTAVVGAVGAYSVSNSPQFVYVLVLAAIQLALVVVAIRRSQARQIALVLFWLQALCIIALLFLVPSSFILILSIVLLVQAVELFGIRQSVLFLIASQFLFLGTQYFYHDSTDWLQVLVSVFLYGLLQIFSISMVQRAINERERREQVAALNRELISTRELLSQTAAQSERVRIARDLHDILGHHMTALILNLEIASHAVEGQPKEKVERSLAMAKLLLSDLRSTVGELRDESSLNLEESIRKLVADIPDFSIDVDFSSAPEINDVEIAETLLRCTQEAVTNVLRHSNADQCLIAMTGSTSNCTLLVSDNGKSAAEIVPGNGLKGMRERVRAKGGDLSWSQNAEGFQLRIELGLATAS